MSGTARRDTRWWTLTAVSLAAFMTTLDNNVVNVALPTIQRDLGLSIAGLEWVVSSYILTFAGLMLVGGRLADIYGQRRLFLTGLAVFTAASLLAGLAPAAGWLITGRALQGAGAALLAPASLAILPAAFPTPRQRNLAVGLWSAVTAISLALGPLAGGLISQHWHWGWIFLINVPVGVATFALSLAVIRQPSGARARRLDLPGLATSTAALSALTYALIEGHSRGWTSPPILAALAAAAATGLAFVAIEAHVKDPMVDLSLFTERIFGGGILALGLWAFGVFGIYFFSALYLQDVLGFSPTAAGAAFVPMALVMAAIAAASGPLTGRLGTRGVVAAGLALMAAAILGVSHQGAHATLAGLMPWLLTYGAGAGLLVPLTAAITGQFPPGRAGAASGILNLAREVFGLLGVTILGAILTTRQTAALHAGAAPLHAFLSGYQLALLIAAAIVAAGIPISLHALRTRRVPAAATQVQATAPARAHACAAALTPTAPR